MNIISRRSVLLAGLGAAGAGALSAAYGGGAGRPPALAAPAGAVAPGRSSPRGGGGTSERRLTLTAGAATADLGGGVTARTWAYEGRVPGREVRLGAGETLVADLANRLPDRATTSVHWHGVIIPNTMDGAPPLTQHAVASGAGYTYRFTAADPGTYFFHTHLGLQVDRGLYGALIVEDPREPLAYDDEWVVVLDDWLDGVTGTPDEAYAELEQGFGSRRDTPPRFALRQARSELLGGHAGNVKYPYHLVNGRVPTDPEVYAAKPGTRVRLRLINAGSDTAYRVALGGHRLTVTHTDGYPVQHQEVDALLIGMGERYDVLVTLQDGVFPLVALAEGKRQQGLALVRTGAGSRPPATVRPDELDGRIVRASRLTAADDARLRSAPADVTYRIRLTGSMEDFDWSIDGRRFDMDRPDADALPIERGQRVRLDFVNHTRMWHPMHLHGHTYQLGESGPRKDTAIVLPGQELSAFFDADNPGRWLLHCHNTYHGEAGMMVLMTYRT